MAAHVPVMVGIASIPEREHALQQTIDSLAQQADRIEVALNDYRRVPTWLDRYPNVHAAITPRRNGGDAEKFRHVDHWDGHAATCDDDLHYPPDYIATLQAGLRRYGPHTMVGFHGGTTLGWNGAAVAASHKRIRCLDDTPHDDPDVNVLGTGTLMWDTRIVPVWRDAFRHANCADVQLACHARELGIPMAALAHPGKWIRDICPPKGRRIFEANKHRDGSPQDTRLHRQTEIQRFDWTQPGPPRPTVHCAIATCSRPRILDELLDDLEREARWVNLHVHVYEDPANGNYSPIRQRVRSLGWQWTRMDVRQGRRYFWRLVDAQLADARESHADWFLFLPDDIRLVRHAIPRAIRTWNRLEAPATLTLWRMKGWEGEPSWTGRRPVDRGEAWETYHVDGNFLCKRPTLDALGWIVGKPRRQHPSSSGVGSMMSKRLHAQRLRMYRVPATLTPMNDQGVSIMNPAECAQRPFYGETL